MNNKLLLHCVVSMMLCCIIGIKGQEYSTANHKIEVIPIITNGNTTDDYGLIVRFTDFDVVNNFYTDNQDSLFVNIWIDGTSITNAPWSNNGAGYKTARKVSSGVYEFEFYGLPLFGANWTDPNSFTKFGFKYINQYHGASQTNNSSDDMFLTLRSSKNAGGDYEIWAESADGTPTMNEDITIYFKDFDPNANFVTNGMSNLYLFYGLHDLYEGHWLSTPTYSNDAELIQLTSATYSGSRPGISGTVYKAIVNFSTGFCLNQADSVLGLDALVRIPTASGTSKTEDLYIDLTTSTYMGPVKYSISSSFLDESSPVTITYNANCNSPLQSANKIYLHSGVSTSYTDYNSFDVVKGNWGADDGVGQMTETSPGSKIWTITLSSLNDFYGLNPMKQDATGLNFLFRSADGTTVDNNNGSNFHKDVDFGNYFTVSSPLQATVFNTVGATVNFTATANVATSSWKISEIDNLGFEISILASGVGSLSYYYNYTIPDQTLKKIRITATFGTEIKCKDYEIKGNAGVVNAPRPVGTIAGINYNASDPTCATLVLHLPTSTNFIKGTGTPSGSNTTVAKNSVHLIGSFNNWQVNDSFLLKRDGDYWWYTVCNLIPGREYVFQYLVDGYFRIADPYSEKISDPDDLGIPSTVYPGLILYPSDSTSHRASVLQTNQTPYSWAYSTNNTRPSSNKLIIYELHFRDFTNEGTYLAAIDKLDYLKNLGINCIHTMPVSEFEGNSSWGYNPNFYFAPDKAYGTKNDLKKFIDEAHKRGISVVNDLVLNHTFKSNPMVRLYSDDPNIGNVIATYDNPWINRYHKAVYDQAGHWGADWNHESEHVQNMIDRILDYWISEYKFDGFRFDFTKGFTQAEPDANDPWASTYDQDRIDLLKRMVNVMWTKHPGSYAIFEHLANDSEDKVLADHGILLWSGAGPQQPYKELANGWGSSCNQSIWGSVHTSRGFNYANYMSYIESHDEQRLGYEVKNYGKIVKDMADGDLKDSTMVSRLKLISAFNALIEGPRMLWEFEELGYDISIDQNGRTGEKPTAWELGYDTKSYRMKLYDLYKTIFDIRNTYDMYNGTIDYGNIGEDCSLATVRRMKLKNADGKEVILIANFDYNSTNSTVPGFTSGQSYHRYSCNIAVNGVDLNNPNAGDSYSLMPGEFVLFTNFLLNTPPAVPVALDAVLGASPYTTTALNITKNAASDSVIILYNTSNTFGSPTANATVGSAVVGGGTVVVKTNGTTYNHTGYAATGGTTIYYQMWSIKNGQISTSFVSDNVVIPNDPPAVPVALDAVLGVSPYTTTALNITKNAASDSVIIIYNTSNTFGTPSTNATVGSAVTGGGTVVVKTNGTTYNHTGYAATGGTTIYYQMWSIKNGQISTSFVSDNVVIPNDPPAVPVALDAVLGVSPYTTTALNITKNAASDSVIIIYNTSNTFGTPSTNATVGSAVTGGGTVVVKTNSTTYNHTGYAATGGTTIYYQMWSIKNGQISTSFVSDNVVIPNDPPTVPVALDAVLGASPYTTTALNITKNAASDSVIIIYNTSNTFGTPTANATVGSAVTGGGTVVVKTNSTTYNHTGYAATGGTTIYYQMWSIKNGQISTSFVSDNVVIPNDPPAVPVALDAVLGASPYTTTALNITKNAASDSVIIIYNTSNKFGTPTANATVGSAVTGGGTVVVKTNGTTYNHTGYLATGGTTIYYQMWSIKNGQISTSFVSDNVVIPNDPPAVPVALDAVLGVSPYTTTALNITKNAASDSVIIIYNTSNTFGTPTANATVGSAVTGGGTVVVKTNGSTYNHTGYAATGGTTIYYQMWSIKNGQISTSFVSDNVLIPNTSNCDNTSVFTNPISGNNTFYAKTMITSTQKITQGSNINYDTKTHCLNPGFEVELGATFETKLTGCN